MVLEMILRGLGQVRCRFRDGFGTGSERLRDKFRRGAAMAVAATATKEKKICGKEGVRGVGRVLSPILPMAATGRGVWGVRASQEILIMADYQQIVFRDRSTLNSVKKVVESLLALLNKLE